MVLYVKNNNTFFLFMLMACTMCCLLTGCVSGTKSIVNENRFSQPKFQAFKTYDGSHSITQTRSGVYVYKDNTVYNTTRRSPNFENNVVNNKSVEFGPSSVKFGVSSY